MLVSAFVNSEKRYNFSSEYKRQIVCSDNLQIAGQLLAVYFDWSPFTKYSPRTYQHDEIVSNFSSIRH